MYVCTVTTFAVFKETGSVEALFYEASYAFTVRLAHWACLHAYFPFQI